MFEDSLIESGGKLKTARGRTTTFSFILEAVIIGVMVLIPLNLLKTLPHAQLMMSLVAPPPPPPPPPEPPAAVHIVKQVQTDIVNGQLRTPTKIPKKVEIIKEEAAPPPSMGVVGGVPWRRAWWPDEWRHRRNHQQRSHGCSQGGRAAAHPRFPGRYPGNGAHKVQPTYPPLARTARVQGSVVLAAVIGKDGTIQNLHVLSGHPLLTQAALDAVRQWRYRPYILNGEPVEVDTQVTVNFTLSGG